VQGIDWGVRLSEICSIIPPNVAVQGNMDPALLIAKPDVAAAEARRILDEMRGRDGFIFNLGHGVPPDADIAVIEAVTQTVQSYA
jgi:uroporphyrinogen decarboxylase